VVIPVMIVLGILLWRRRRRIEPGATPAA